MRTFLIFLYSFTLFASTGVLAAQNSNSEIDQHILSLVKAQDFDKLESLLVALENSYESDYRNEDQVDQAFHAFYRASTDLIRPLDNWIKAKPNSYVAYTARGIYFTRVGWASRGSKYLDETSQKQLDGMDYYFQKAIKDFEHARSIDGKLLHPLCYEMDILENYGAKEQIRKLHDEALRINPLSLTARWYYITTILPRWGGSISEIEKEVESARPFYSKNPTLRVLDGRVAAELGDQAFFNEDYAKAEQLYTDALKFGSHWYYLKQRGESYSYNGLLENSNNDLQSALELRPNSDRVFYMLGMNLYKKKQYAEAISFLSKAINRNQYDHKAIDIRGDCYRRLGKLDLALADFEHAVALKPENTEYSADRNRVLQMKIVPH